MSPLKAPFPWFGGKSRAAALIWERFGNVDNYVEPFAGSLAVLLARPHPPSTETVNDLDCYLANFWRAVQLAPAEVALWADAPVNEADLHARHTWLIGREEFRERIKRDPDFYDAKVAGWWVWGLSCWIGSGWCAMPKPGCKIERKRPEITYGKARGVVSKLPNIDARGAKGSVKPSIDAMCDRAANRAAGSALVDWFGDLCERLRRVRVCCGDWRRVLGPTPLGLTSNVPKRFRTAVFLDPPYAGELRHIDLYAEDNLHISAEVRTWAIAHGDDHRLRIALCGYDGEHVMPPSWTCVEWKAGGGYGNRTGNDNAHRERIWFSPHCLKPADDLFATAGAA